MGPWNEEVQNLRNISKLSPWRHCRTIGRVTHFRKLCNSSQAHQWRVGSGVRTPQV